MNDQELFEGLGHTLPQMPNTIPPRPKPSSGSTGDEMTARQMFFIWFFIIALILISAVALYELTAPRNAVQPTPMYVIVVTPTAEGR